MSKNDSFHKMVSEAENSLKEVEAASIKSGKQFQTVRKTNLTVLFGVLIILTGFKLFYIEARDGAIARDVEESALDLIMQADTSVVLYRDQFGMLPEILPDYTLRPFVDYSRVDANNYTLRLHIDGYDEAIPVQAAQTLSVSEVSRILHLERLN